MHYPGDGLVPHRSFGVERRGGARVTGRYLPGRCAALGKDGSDSDCGNDYSHYSGSSRGGDDDTGDPPRSKKPSSAPTDWTFGITRHDAGGLPAVNVSPSGEWVGDAPGCARITVGGGAPVPDE